MSDQPIPCPWCNHHHPGRCIAMPSADAHVYLSTGCLHGRHDYCQSARVGRVGSPIQHWTKQPASCKFCAAPCVCDCHVPTDHGADR